VAAVRTGVRLGESGIVELVGASALSSVFTPISHSGVDICGVWRQADQGAQPPIKSQQLARLVVLVALGLAAQDKYTLKVSAAHTRAMNKQCNPGRWKAPFSPKPLTLVLDVIGSQTGAFEAVRRVVLANGLPHQNLHPRRRRSTFDAPSVRKASS
jgi:hypothetical protein